MTTNVDFLVDISNLVELPESFKLFYTIFTANPIERRNRKVLAVKAVTVRLKKTTCGPNLSVAARWKKNIWFSFWKIILL